MRRAAALLLLLVSCGKAEPTVIDGSSPEERLQFDRALRTVGGRRHAERDPAALARVTFDGMTAAQVVADQRARER